MSFRSAGKRFSTPGKDTKSKESKCEDFDDVLDIVGSQGKYQKFLLYAVLSPITALEPLFTLNVIFMLFEPDHWCFVPGRDNGTSLDAWKNLTIPREAGPDGLERLSQCSMFNASGDIVGCSNGWQYDTTDYESTIPSAFNWVCDKSHYATDAFTLAAVGNALGTIVFGQAADKFGRRPIFFITCALNLVFRVISVFIAQHFVVFLIFQFIIGTAFPLMYIAPAMIAAEVCDKDYRAWVYSFTWMTWVFGMASLPLLAWLTRTWFYMGLATSIPGFVLLLYWWYIPESPRWLISQGRVEEATKIIRKIAETNGTSDKLTPAQLDGMLKTLVIKQDQNDKNVGVWTLFSRPRLAKHTLLVTISWSMNNLIYYGITLNATNLSGNQFVNFFLLAIIEVPSGYFGGLLADKMGRRWTQVLFFISCMLTSFGAGVGALYPDLTVVVIICIVIAKFSVTLTFLVVYMQATEVFPTQLRSTGNGFSSTVACATSIVAPYMVFLGKVNVALPYIFLGAMAAVGVISSAFLPETLNQSLPETLDEAENFGKSEKFWSFCPEQEDGKGVRHRNKSSSNGNA